MRSRAANVAIALVVLGWLSSGWGVLSQLGDPAPWVPKAELEAHRRVATAFLLFGILFVLCSLWLSGYSFSTARWRAIFVALCGVAPVVALFLFAFRFS